MMPLVLKAWQAWQMYKAARELKREFEKGLSMSEKESKKWWQSKTILASVAVLMASGAGAVGFAVDAQSLEMLLTNIAAAVGGAVAIYGRIKAEKPIG